MKRKVADTLKKISIFWLNQNSLLKPQCRTDTSVQWTNRYSEYTDCVTIQISLLKNDKSIRLSYADTGTDGQKTEYNYRVQIVADRCRFGGARYWFICPLTVNGRYCGRRTAVLYKGNGYFGCRSCFNLTYRSKNINRYSRHYPAMAVIDADLKAETLEKNIKRRSYRGKPTRKQLRINELYAKSLPYLLAVRNMTHGK